MTTVERAELTAARARAGRIRQGIHSYLDTLSEIAAAYEARDWSVLGYPDWSSYVDEEYGADRLRLPAEHRQKAITELRLAGMSQRAIAAVVGVDQKTVSNDLRAASGEEYSSPGTTITGADGKTYPAVRRPDQGPVSDETPAAVRGSDGKSHPAEPGPSPLVQALSGVIEATAEQNRSPVRPECESGANAASAAKKVHRKPLPDTARSAGWELNRVVEQVERIVTDDRFAANAQQVATHLRHHLLRSIEALTEVLNQLPETKENGTA